MDETIAVEACQDMGRINSAANFVEAIEGKAAPLNSAEQGLQLMQIIDAVYESAASGKPVAI